MEEKDIKASYAKKDGSPAKGIRRMTLTAEN